MEIMHILNIIDLVNCGFNFWCFTSILFVTASYAKLLMLGIAENSIRRTRHNSIHDQVWTSTYSWHESATNCDGCTSHGGIRRRNWSTGDCSKGAQAPKNTSYRKKVEFFLLKNLGNIYFAANTLIWSALSLSFLMKNMLYFLLKCFIVSENVNRFLHLDYVDTDMKWNLQPYPYHSSSCAKKSMLENLSFWTK